MKLADLKEGDIIVSDSGFTCLPTGNHEVFLAPPVINHIISPVYTERLYVKCDQGKHFLDGSIDWENDEHLIGWSKES